MKLDIVPESLLERFLLAAGAVPVPLVHTLVGILISRTILAAARLGIFKALSEGSNTVSQVAKDCDTNPAATANLLNALAGIGYLKVEGEAYELSSAVKKWLSPGSGDDITDAILHRDLDAALMENAESYVRSGVPIDFHRELSEFDWGVYTRGQKSQAAFFAPEIVRRVTLPSSATHLLDIGGGHGLLADAMCKKNDKLSAVVLDLPAAIGNVDRSELSDRVTFLAADILSYEPVEETYDIVLICNLVHHFSDQQNKSILEKSALALRPGGICIVADFVQSTGGRTASQIPALLDFYFSVTSGGGVPSKKDIVLWMHDAGLTHTSARPIRTAPGMWLIIGRKDS